MYNANNVKALKGVVRRMGRGEKLYVNAINLTTNAIEQLREYVKGGALIPDRAEVEKSYKDVEAVMSGKTIFPQMTYIKQ